MSTNCNDFTVQGSSTYVGDPFQQHNIGQIYQHICLTLWSYNKGQKVFFKKEEEKTPKRTPPHKKQHKRVIVNVAESNMA